MFHLYSTVGKRSLLMEWGQDLLGLFWELATPQNMNDMSWLHLASHGAQVPSSNYNPRYPGIPGCMNEVKLCPFESNTTMKKKIPP